MGANGMNAEGGFFATESRPIFLAKYAARPIDKTFMA
jgi:hypothetical protein